MPNVYVGDNAWFADHGFRPQVIPTKAGPLQVAFLPWPQVSTFQARNPDLQGASIDQVMAAVKPQAPNVIGEQARALDPGLPAILACHVSINEFIVREREASERWMTVGTARAVSKARCTNGTSITSPSGTTTTTCRSRG